MKLADVIPDPDALIALKAEELGLRMLPVLAAWPHNGKQLQLVQFLPPRTPVAPHQDFLGYPAGPRTAQIESALREAWGSLVAQALLVPDPRFSDEVFMLSSRAQKLAESEPDKSISSDEWIRASTAIEILKAAMGFRIAAMAMAARANDGILPSRADRFVRDRRVENDVELPSQFWWARGHGALEQNWTTGDFATWIEQREHWRAYGVHFLRSQIEKMLPAASGSAGPSAMPKIRKIFIVHGHDEVALLGAARFVEQLGLEAVVLRERPDKGRTIIEKFEDCAAEVGFAIVLLSPDDLAGPADGPAVGAQARQNVIFELGYFAGKLGRGRTCLLRKGKVELPSDLYGVIYTEMDVGEGWKRKLAQELKEAGLDFDPAKLLT